MAEIRSINGSMIERGRAYKRRHVHRLFSCEIITCARKLLAQIIGTITDVAEYGY